MPPGLRGQRVVVGLYLSIVAFAGVAGYATATIVDEITAPRFLFVIEFPATPLGLAAYGALTIGLILGILLVAVTIVSDRVDDAAPGSSTEPVESTERSRNLADQPTDSTDQSTNATKKE